MCILDFASICVLDHRRQFAFTQKYPADGRQLYRIQDATPRRCIRWLGLARCWVNVVLVKPLEQLEPATIGATANCTFPEPRLDLTRRNNKGPCNGLDSESTGCSKSYLSMKLSILGRSYQIALKNASIISGRLLSRHHVADVYSEEVKMHTAWILTLKRYDRMVR